MLHGSSTYVPNKHVWSALDQYTSAAAAPKSGENFYAASRMYNNNNKPFDPYENAIAVRTKNLQRLADLNLLTNQEWKEKQLDDEFRNVRAPNSLD